MAEYSYDDSGAIFNFFLLTLLASLLIPYTLSFRKPIQAKRVASCACPPCTLKVQEPVQKSTSYTKCVLCILHKRLGLLVLGWCLFGWVAYRSATMEIVEMESWNPYRILDVQEVVSSNLSLKKTRMQTKQSSNAPFVVSVFNCALFLLLNASHPDKVAAEDRPEAEKRFVDISKAYKV